MWEVMLLNNATGEKFNKTFTSFILNLPVPTWSILTLILNLVSVANKVAFVVILSICIRI